MNHSATRFERENEVMHWGLDDDDTISSMPDLIENMTDKDLCHALFSVVDWHIFSTEPSWEISFGYSELNFLRTMLELEEVDPKRARYAYYIHKLQEEYQARFSKGLRTPLEEPDSSLPDKPARKWRLKVDVENPRCEQPGDDNA